MLTVPLVFWTVLALPTEVRAGQVEDRHAAGLKFSTLVRAGDTHAAKAMLGVNAYPCAISLSQGLLLHHLASDPTTTVGPTALLADWDTLIDLLANRGHIEAIRSMRDAYRAYDQAAWDRERALLRVFHSQRAHRAKRAFDPIVAMADHTASLVASQSASLIAIEVQHFVGDAMYGLNRREKGWRWSKASADRANAMRVWDWAAWRVLDLAFIQWRAGNKMVARKFGAEAIAIADRTPYYRWHTDFRFRVANIQEINEATSMKRAAVELAVASGDVAFAHRTRSDLAIHFAWGGQGLIALEVAEAGLAAAKQGRDAFRLAESRVTYGRVLMRSTSRHAEGVSMIEAGLDPRLQTDPPRLFTVQTHLFLAWALGMVGDTRGALRNAKACHRLATVLRDVGLIAAANQQIAVSLIALDRAAEAEPYAREALKTFAKHENSTTAFAMEVVAMGLRERGEFDAALGMFAEAAALHKRFGGVASLAYQSVEVARLYLMAGEPAKAIAAIDEWKSARLAQDGADSLMSRIQAVRAQALLRLKQYEGAVVSARASMAARIELSRGLASSEAVSGQRLAWEAAHAGTIAVVRLAQASKSAESKTAFATSAFHLMESSRALLLHGQVRNRNELMRAKLPPELVREFVDSRAAVEDARAALLVALRQDERDTAKAAVSVARGLVEQTWSRHEGVLRRVRRKSHLIALVAHPDPLALDALQQRLRPRDAWISYGIGPHGVSALLVRRDTARLVDLGPSKGLERDIARWVQRLSTPDARDLTLAHRLDARLIAPLRPHLHDADRLLISPEGALALVPYCALAHYDKTAGGSETQQTRRLVEEVEVVLVPSASFWFTLQDEAKGAKLGRRLLAVGDPDYSALPKDVLPPLPHTRVEVERVAEAFAPNARTLLLGKNASVNAVGEALRSSLEPWRAIHLACHSAIRPKHPDRSGMVLSGGEVLDVDEIFRTPTPADLVVLSACETSRGEIVPGEGVMGLMRAFLFAGARRVASTYWCVPDDSTPDLMAAFYRYHLVDEESATRALRHAQLDRLKAGGERAHPYHWAAFVVWGLP